MEDPLDNKHVYSTLGESAIVQTVGNGPSTDPDQDWKATWVQKSKAPENDDLSQPSPRDRVRIGLRHNCSKIILAVIILLVLVACGVVGYIAWKVTHIPQGKAGEVSSPCSSEPCLYGGSCTDNGHTHVCNCTEQHTGRHCEIDLGGPELDLVLDIASCSASSTHSDGLDCQYAYDGSDRPGNKREWAAQFQGIGAWMTVVFHHPHLVTEVELLQRCYRGEQNKAMMLQFGDGSQQELSLQCYNVSDSYLNCDGIDWQSFPLEPVATTVIKFIITDVCSSNHNGIRELRIYGH